MNAAEQFALHQRRLGIKRMLREIAAKSLQRAHGLLHFLVPDLCLREVKLRERRAFTGLRFRPFLQLRRINGL